MVGSVAICYVLPTQAPAQPTPPSVSISTPSQGVCYPPPNITPPPGFDDRLGGGRVVQKVGGGGGRGTPPTSTCATTQSSNLAPPGCYIWALEMVTRVILGGYSCTLGSPLPHPPHLRQKPKNQDNCRCLLPTSFAECAIVEEACL